MIHRMKLDAFQAFPVNIKKGNILHLQLELDRDITLSNQDTIMIEIASELNVGPPIAQVEIINDGSDKL